MPFNDEFTLLQKLYTAKHTILVEKELNSKTLYSYKKTRDN